MSSLMSPKGREFSVLFFSKTNKVHEYKYLLNLLDKSFRTFLFLISLHIFQSINYSKIQ